MFNQETFRTGPSNVIGTIGGTPEFSVPTLSGASSSQSDEDTKVIVAQLAEIAAVTIAISEGPSLLEKWTGKKLKARVAEYKKALANPEILWTIAACQLAIHNFPNVEDARGLMAIMDSESDFNTRALNPAKAYGLLQIIPSNVKHISKWPLKDKQALIRDIEPVVKWVEVIDPEIARNMRSGVWPETLIVAEPLWQIPFIAVLWREANLDLSRSFKWTGKSWAASTSGKFKVENKSFLSYMKSHPEVFEDYGAGKTAILANLWKHGAPRGLRTDVPLHYLNDKVDHITPIVQAYYNLGHEATVDEQIDNLMVAISKDNFKVLDTDSPLVRELKKAVIDLKGDNNPLLDFFRNKLK